MTRDDVLHGNRDLLERAGELLAAAPVHRLELVDTEVADDELVLTVRAVGVDRVDVWLDDRPAGSADVGDELTVVPCGPGTAPPCRPDRAPWVPRR
jgi:hypothetical protein